MNSHGERCRNMNHGRLNLKIQFCPDCGEKFSAGSKQSCDETKHASRRKDRGNFCYDCGKKLR